MFKKVFGLLVCVVIFIGIVGCSKEKEITLGTYVLDSDIGFLVISIDEGSKFTFVNPVLSSIPPTGNYNLKNGKITLVFDENNKYVFELKEESLVFDKGASVIVTGDYPGFEGIENGVIFNYSVG